jgi:hypothetical protein
MRTETTWRNLRSAPPPHLATLFPLACHSKHRRSPAATHAKRFAAIEAAVLGHGQAGGGHWWLFVCVWEDGKGAAASGLF